MRGSKITAVSLITTGLLAASMVGVAAQDETDGAVPVPFTVRFIPSSQVRAGQDTTEDGVTKATGSCWAPIIADPSDPRLAGRLVWCWDEYEYGYGSDEDPSVGSGTYRIENDGGAWQGSHHEVFWVDTASGEEMDAGNVVILVGEGEYEGFYAAMTFLPDWSDMRGVIFEGSPPDAPVPPSAE